jgi:hypothetical protein
MGNISVSVSRNPKGKRRPEAVIINLRVKMVCNPLNFSINILHAIFIATHLNSFHINTISQVKDECVCHHMLNIRIAQAQYYHTHCRGYK